MDDVTLGKMLTEAHRGQVNYCEPEGMSVSQSSSSVVFDGSGKPDGERKVDQSVNFGVTRNTYSVHSKFSGNARTEKMVDGSGKFDERNSSNAQIRTLLEEQRQTIIAEYREKVSHHELQAAHAEEERRLLQGQLWRQKLEFREVHQQSLTEMEELRKFQSSTFDTIARRKLIEDQNTILELSGRVQELQNEVNCMNGSKDFQDAESVRSGNSHVTSRPVSFPPHPIPGGMLSRFLGMPSRIDMAFLNPMAARLLNNVHVHEVPEYGIKLHKPLQVNLDFCGTREFAYATPKIRGIPMITHKMSAEDIEQLGNEIMDRHASRFFKSWEIGNVDAVWEDWCQLAESYIVEKGAFESGEYDIINDPRYYGRGRASTVQRVRVDRASHTAQGVCVDLERRELHKLVECSHELTAIYETGSIQHCNNLWTKIGRIGQQTLPNLPFRKAWKTSSLPTKGALQTLLSAVSEVLEKVSKGDRERFIRSYQRRLVEKTKKNVKDLVKHFRDPEQGTISILKKEDGSITGSISEMDELLRKCWLPIFAKHDESHPEPDAQESMNKYGEYIPCVQQGLPIITVKDLRDALNRIPSSGAGGLDAWKPGELKQLPNQMLEMLLLLFDLVECGLKPWHGQGLRFFPKEKGALP